MAARTRKGTMQDGWSDQVKARIKTSMLLNRLSEHVVGNVEMSSTQVRAAEILLKKTVPDLSQVAATVAVLRQPEEMTDAELADIAAGRSSSDDQEADGAGESGSLH